MWPWLIFLSQEWLEWQLEQPDWAVQLQDDERFLTILVVLLCINFVFRKLYSSGVWLPQDVALEVGRQGMTALRGYAKLAKISMEMNEPQYPLYPKVYQSFTCYCTNFGGSFGGVQSPNGSKALCAIHAKCARPSLATSAGTVGEWAHPAQWIAQSTCI